MSYQLVNKILKVSILILLVLLLIFIFQFKTSDCDLCKFEYHNSTIGANKFMNYYTEECFHQNGIGLNLSLFN